MTRILYSPLAEADFEDIWLFTAQRWSTEQAVGGSRQIVVLSVGTGPVLSA